MSLATTFHDLAEQLDGAVASLDTDTLSADEAAQLHPVFLQLQRRLGICVSYADARATGDNVRSLPLRAPSAAETAASTLDEAELAAYASSEFAYARVSGDSFVAIDETPPPSGVRFEWVGSHCIVSREA